MDGRDGPGPFDAAASDARVTTRADGCGTPRCPPLRLLHGRLHADTHVARAKETCEIVSVSASVYPGVPFPNSARLRLAHDSARNRPRSPINTAEPQAGLLLLPSPFAVPSSPSHDRRLPCLPPPPPTGVGAWLGRRLRALRGRAGGRPTSAVSKVRTPRLSRSFFFLISSLLCTPSWMLR